MVKLKVQSVGKICVVFLFQGRVMAITGYEQDQVMVTPENEAGVSPDLDVSVPINWAYNHHYLMWMTGKHSKMVEVTDVDPEDTSAHGLPRKWEAVDNPNGSRHQHWNVPTSQYFAEGNGGESRKSFHGYPDGYAQLIYSPDQWHIMPMQIDTRNRNCGVKPKDIYTCTNNEHPGPEPRQARFGRGTPEEESVYSGLIECPCTSRFGGDALIYGETTKTKIVNHRLEVSSTRNGQSDVSNPVDCFNAVAQLSINVDENATVFLPSNDEPQGCSVKANANGKLAATFSKFKSSKRCSPSLNKSGTVNFHVGIKLTVDLNTTTATITISGSAKAYFAVGFNATRMSNKPYVIYVNDDGVHEQQIGTCGGSGHCAGTALKPFVNVVSSKVVDDVRTVVLTRPLQGLTKEYYTFDPAKQSQIPVLAAVGHSQNFDKHMEETRGTLILLDEEGPTCICNYTTVSLCDKDGLECVNVTSGCGPSAPNEQSLLSSFAGNPQAYLGGMRCCGHRRVLLDEDQQAPANPLRYHLKFRFWFQDYKESGNEMSHHNLQRIAQPMVAEYNVPPAFVRQDHVIPGYSDWPQNTETPRTTCTGNCPDGDDCQCVHTFTFRWTVSNVRLIYAIGHCHAPSCLRMELYRNDTGHNMELLCRQVPIYGKGNVVSDRFDEVGHVKIPPCLWGEDEGLELPVFLPENTTLVSVKYSRNTDSGHYAEMAYWQMRGVHD